MQQLTQQLRIFPTPEQQEVLWVLSEKCRLIYNFALAERIAAWKNGIQGITYTKQQNDLPKIKETYPAITLRLVFPPAERLMIIIKCGMVSTTSL